LIIKNNTSRAGDGTKSSQDNGKSKSSPWKYKILKLDDAYDVARHCDMNNPFCFPVDTDPWDY